MSTVDLRSLSGARPFRPELVRTAAVLGDIDQDRVVATLDLQSLAGVFLSSSAPVPTADDTAWQTFAGIAHPVGLDVFRGRARTS